MASEEQRIIGCDIGLKHLALCGMSSTVGVVLWKVLDCTEYITDFPSKKPTISQCTAAVIAGLQSIAHELESFNPTTLCIEIQPAGRGAGPASSINKTLEHVVQAYFLLLHPATSVVHVSARTKLSKAGHAVPKDYSERKKLAVAVVREGLSARCGSNPFDLWTQYFVQHKKKDDLADAYLIARNHIAEQREPKRSAKAKKSKKKLEFETESSPPATAAKKKRKRKEEEITT